MATPINILQQVTTYQPSALAYLENLNCFINTFNTKFDNFKDISANLGDTVNFDLPYRFTSASGLVARFQAINQRIHSLKVDQAENVAYTVTNQQRVFNLDKDSYMEKIGKGAIEALSSKVEINVAQNAISNVPVMTVDSEGNSVPTGAYHTESGPFRAFGTSTAGVVQPINSYQQLAQAIADFKEFGAVKSGIKVYIPQRVQPSIVGSGLSQFVPKRNDEIAMSWEIGEFGTPPVQYYTSNLLPIQYAGTVGTSAQTLTVVSMTKDSTGTITQIVFSGATPNDQNAVKRGDIFTFKDSVGSFPNLRYLTFIGQNPTGLQVQFRTLADAPADGSGYVTINILPGLQSNADATQNINYPIVAGMQCTVLGSHRAGLIIAGDAGYLAMPKLDDESPFITSSSYDEATGVALRMYYGSLFGRNQKGLVHDVIFGSTVVPEYSMRLAFPLTV